MNELKNVSMQKLASRLKELRRLHNISQAQLSKETGLSQSSIDYWEKEKRVPSAIAVITLARYFDITTDYLLGEEN